MICYGRKRSCNSFQVLFGYFCQREGVSKRAISVLNRMGICCSYNERYIIEYWVLTKQPTKYQAGWPNRMALHGWGRRRTSLLMPISQFPIWVICPLKVTYPFNRDTRDNCHEPVRVLAATLAPNTR